MFPTLATRTKSPSSAEIEAWMVARLAEGLKVAREEIDLHTPFSDFGLDSVAGLQLTGDLEGVVGRALEPTLLYEYPTIATLARHLGG